MSWISRLFTRPEPRALTGWEEDYYGHPLPEAVRWRYERYLLMRLKLDFDTLAVRLDKDALKRIQEAGVTTYEAFNNFVQTYRATQEAFKRVSLSASGLGYTCRHAFTALNHYERDLQELEQVTGCHSTKYIEVIMHANGYSTSQMLSLCNAGYWQTVQRRAAKMSEQAQELYELEQKKFEQQTQKRQGFDENSKKKL